MQFCVVPHKVCVSHEIDLLDQKSEDHLDPNQSSVVDLVINVIGGFSLGMKTRYQRYPWK